MVKLGVKQTNKKVKEKVIQARILAYLLNKGISVDIITSGIYSGKGIADIIGCLPDGRYLAIEVKTPNKDATDLQDLWLKEKRKNNAITMVAHSVDEVSKLLRGYGYE